MTLLASRFDDVMRHGCPTAERVLVVENNPGINAFLCCALTFQKYQPVPVHGTMADLTWIDLVDSSKGIALMLLDVSLMPLALAGASLHSVQARWRSVHGLIPPILVLTTSPLIYNGLVDYPILLKPFPVRRLLAFVQEMIPYRDEAALERSPR